MYQTPFSDQIRNEGGLATMCVGAITSADQVNTIIAAGRADLVALARPHLVDPFFTMRAATRSSATASATAKSSPSSGARRGRRRTPRLGGRPRSRASRYGAQDGSNGVISRAGGGGYRELTPEIGDPFLAGSLAFVDCLFAASLAKRSARRRAILARTARCSASYSCIASAASRARPSLAAAAAPC
jgi:hypothetical protein